MTALATRRRAAATMLGALVAAGYSNLRSAVPEMALPQLELACSAPGNVLRLSVASAAAASMVAHIIGDAFESMIAGLRFCEFASVEVVQTSAPPGEVLAAFTVPDQGGAGAGN